MVCYCIRLFYILAFINFATGALAQPASLTHEWGLMLHDDGDLLFQPQKKDSCSDYVKEEDSIPEAHLAYIRCRYAAFRNAGIDTLKLNIFSSLAYFDFDRKIAPTLSRLDSRVDVFDRNRYIDVAPRIDLAAKLFGLGPRFDPVALALREFRRQGGKTVLSFRIADSHYLQVSKGSSSAQHPFSPQFALDNPAWSIGESHVSKGDDPRLGGLMDYAKAEVRVHFVNTVRAAVQKYGGVIDGIEIDFTRNPVLFRAESARSNSHLIDELLADVRQAINGGNARKLKILVRVPADIDYAREHGIDIESWIMKRRVDVIIPSELMNVNHDPDLDRLSSLTKANGIGLYYGLPGRQNPTLWRMNATSFLGDDFMASPAISNECDTACIKGKLIRYKLPTPDYLIGAALNARAKGADGVELYNFASESIRSSKWFSEILIPNLKTLAPTSRVTYSASQYVSQGTYRKPPPSLRKLPIAVPKGTPANFRIFVGSSAVFKQAAQLRIGLLNKSSAICNARMVGEDRSLERIAAYASSLENSNPSARNDLRNTALNNPGQFFPESALVFGVSPDKIKTGYNEFQLLCDDENIMLEATLLTSRNEPVKLIHHHTLSQ